MPAVIFVNLPVADLDVATGFYAAIGCEQDHRFSAPGQAAAMTWSDTITFMLLSHEFFAGFTPRAIADAHATTEVLIALSFDSREQVDAMVRAGGDAGGTIDIRAPQDMGFLYSRAIADPDGHILEPMFMDADAAFAASGAAA